jgi:hypothetical protein
VVGDTHLDPVLGRVGGAGRVMDDDSDLVGRH